MIRTWLRTVSVSIGALGVLPAVAHAGKLQSVRSEVRGGSSSSSSSDSSSSSSSGSSFFDDDDDDSGECCANGGLDFEPDEFPRYARFPYRNGEPGYVRLIENRNTDKAGTRLIGGSAQIEGGYVFSKIYRSGFALDLNAWRFGFKSDLSFFLEGPLRDALYLGSSNLHFAAVMLPRMRWRAGGGVQYMLDGRTPGQGRREYAAGGNFTTDLDLFPFWPVVVSGRFDYGRIYKAPSILARATLGLTLQGFELYGGYEYRRIGRVDLQGPTVGLRVWF